MATCKSCGARITFIRSLKGKYLPVNLPLIFWRRPDPIIGEVGMDTIVSPDGMVVKKCVVSDKNGAYEGYVPHWATCPHADKFRRKP